MSPHPHTLTSTRVLAPLFPPSSHISSGKCKGEGKKTAVFLSRLGVSGAGMWPSACEPLHLPRFQAVLLEIQDAVAQAGQVVREAVGGLKTVRSFGAEELEACRYEEALERCRKLWWQRDLERALYLLFRRVSGVPGGRAGNLQGSLQLPVVGTGQGRCWNWREGLGTGGVGGEVCLSPTFLLPPRCCTWQCRC